jgi:DNA gyrase subunit B
MAETSSQSYDPMEHMRLRPGMYLGQGGKDNWALHQLLYNVIDNAIDQARSGNCSHINVMLLPDNMVTIQDDGPGIPVEVNEEFAKPILELVFTRAAGRYNPQTQKFIKTFFGAGLPVVNALSAFLQVVVMRDGFVWQQEFRAGIPQTELQQMRPMSSDEHTGTSITLMPDFRIFDTNNFQPSILLDHLRDLAALTPTVFITLRDMQAVTPSEQVFHFENGLLSYLEYLREHSLWNSLPVHIPLEVKRAILIDFKGQGRRSVQIELLIQYASKPVKVEHSFACRCKLSPGRPHMYGLRAGLRDFLNAYALKKGILVEGDLPFTYEEVLVGLITIVNFPDLQPSQPFGATCDFPYQELKLVMYDFVTEALQNFASQHPIQMRTLVDWLVSRRFND